MVRVNYAGATKYVLGSDLKGWYGKSRGLSLMISHYPIEIEVGKNKFEYTNILWADNSSMTPVITINSAKVITQHQITIVENVIYFMYISGGILYGCLINVNNGNFKIMNFGRATKISHLRVDGVSGFSKYTALNDFGLLVNGRYNRFCMEMIRDI